MKTDQQIPTLATWADQPWAMDRGRLDAFCRRLGAAAVSAHAHTAENVTADSGNLDHVYQVVGSAGIINLVGPILKGAPSWLRDYMDFVDVVEARSALALAVNDPAIESIALLIDSPGGTVGGVQQLADDVFAATDDKPVVAIVDDLCCSAAYWIAAQADQVVANPTAAIGSIGVYNIADDYSRFYENLGVATHVFASGQAKGQGTEYSERITPPQMDALRRRVSDLAELFIAAVARGRGMTPAAARALATGEYWIASEAQRLGLIDDGKADAGAAIRAMAAGA